MSRSANYIHILDTCFFGFLVRISLGSGLQQSKLTARPTRPSFWGTGHVIDLNPVKSLPFLSQCRVANLIAGKTRTRRPCCFTWNGASKGQRSTLAPDILSLNGLVKNGLVNNGIPRFQPFWHVPTCVAYLGEHPGFEWTNGFVGKKLGWMEWMMDLKILGLDPMQGLLPSIPPLVQVGPGAHPWPIYVLLQRLCNVFIFEHVQQETTWFTWFTPPLILQTN